MTPSMANPAYWDGGDIPWISSKEVVGGVLSGTERKVTRLAVEETSLRLVPAGSVVVVVRSGILLHTLPVALVPFDSTVNQDIKIGKPVDDVLPEFLAFTLQANAEQILQRFRKTGTTVQSIDVPGLMSLEIGLPSLSEQRRIVDLIGALDTQVEALAAETQQGRVVLERLLDGLWDDLADGTATTVGHLAELTSGPSWAASDETALLEHDSLPVVKITNTRPDGTLDLSERLYVRGLPRSTRLLDERSLIAIRTNGNRERIGNVYLPTSEVFGSAVSAFQFIVQAMSRESRDYLYWALRAPRCQRLMSDAASGSTGLGNMGARWLRALEIPWPDEPQRFEFVARASTTESLLDAMSAELDALRVLRATLLADLLSGQIEIPEAYDASLSEVV